MLEFFWEIDAPAGRRR